MRLPGVQGWWRNNQTFSLKRQTMLTGSKQPVPDAQATDQARAYRSSLQLTIDLAFASILTPVSAMEAAQL